MNPASVQSIFLHAIELDSETEREAYLSEVCANDAAVRSEVDRLIEAHFRDGNPLDTRPVDVRSNSKSITELEVGDFIGPYKLLQLLGEGGMGSVYMAEQLSPVERRVAIKIIRPGMATKQILARFDAERQTLALMDHPNIARIIDAGESAQRQPYFVMELIKGRPITEYCDEQRLGTKERLKLFADVCNAVQHAHQRGIIHRDLKPSNVLIAQYDDKPIVKIIDFGIAKALGQQLTDKTMFTQFGQVLGTLEYMSPEQSLLNQLDIDTRTDIYSLGVLLYELLCGERPFERELLEKAALDEAFRIIREQEPMKPSRRLASSNSRPAIAARRVSEASKLESQLRGDLDWIVMKAIDKDRGRRYLTCNAFAEDVESFLKNEPIQARPPSLLYQTQKFAARNKSLLAALSAIAIALLLGMSGTIWQAVRATSQLQRAVKAEELAEQRLEVEKVLRKKAEAAERIANEQSQRADKEAERARRESESGSAVINFLNHDLLGLADVESMFEAGLPPDPNITLRTVLDRAESSIEGKFKDQPLVEASIRTIIGDTYANLGEYSRNIEQARKALALHRCELGDEHPETLQSMRLLSSGLGRAGRYSEALELADQAYELSCHHLGEDDLNTLQIGCGRVIRLRETGHYKEAYEFGNGVLERCERVLGVKDKSTIAVTVQLALTCHALKKQDEVVRLLERARDLSAQKYGSDHPESIFLEGMSSSFRYENEKNDEFLRGMEDAVRRLQKTLGGDSPRLYGMKNALALALMDAGRVTQAIRLLEEALQESEALHGENYHGNRVLKINLATCYSEARRYEEAVKLFKEVIANYDDVMKDGDPNWPMILRNFGRHYSRVGEYSKALPLYRQAFDVARTELGEEHIETIKAMNGLAEVYFDMGQYQEAIQWGERCVRLRRKIMGDKHPKTLGSLGNLASAYLLKGEVEKALVISKAVYASHVKAFGDDDYRTLTVMNNIGLVLLNYNKFDEVEAWLLPAHEGLQRLRGADHPSTLVSFLNLMGLWLQNAEYEKLLAIDSEVFDAFNRVLGEDNAYTLFANSNRAVAYFRTGEKEKGIRIQEDSVHLSRTHYGDKHPTTLDLKDTLAVLYAGAEMFEEAIGLGEKTRSDIQETLGVLHPRYINVTSNLADALRDVGRVDDAIKLKNESLELSESVFGKDNQRTILLAGELADYYLLSRRFEEALSFLKTRDSADPGWLISRIILARAYSDIEQYRTDVAAIKEATRGEVDSSKRYLALVAELIDPDAALDKEGILKETQVLAQSTSFTQYQLLHAVALLRCSMCEEAIEILAKSYGDWQREPDRLLESYPACAAFYLALAHKNLGDANQCQIWFERAKLRTKEELEADTSPTVWMREIMYRICEQEIESLMAKSE